MLFGKLLPREGNFFELFNQHGKLIAEGARAFQGDGGRTTTIPRCARNTIEMSTTPRSAADRITAEVNRLLHKTFITPIDREQIHADQRHGRHPRPAPGLGRGDGAVRRAPIRQRGCAR
jgi:uncharacterized protein Yka (UPF0111/DUF47 family)